MKPKALPFPEPTAGDPPAPVVDPPVTPPVDPAPPADPPTSKPTPFDSVKTGNILARQKPSDVEDALLIATNRNPELAKLLMGDAEPAKPEPTPPADPAAPAPLSDPNAQIALDRVAALEIENWQMRAASEFSLGNEHLEFLKGTTQAEIRDAASSLATMLGDATKAGVESVVPAPSDDPNNPTPPATPKPPVVPKVKDAPPPNYTQGGGTHASPDEASAALDEMVRTSQGLPDGVQQVLDIPNENLF